MEPIQMEVMKEIVLKNGLNAVVMEKRCRSGKN